MMNEKMMEEQMPMEELAEHEASETPVKEAKEEASSGMQYIAEFVDSLTPEQLQYLRDYIAKKESPSVKDKFAAEMNEE